MLRLQLVDQKEWVLACASSSVLNKWSNTLQEQLGERGRGEVSVGWCVLGETCADSLRTALQLLPVPTQPQTTLHRGANTRQSVTSGTCLLCSRVAAPPFVMQPHPAHLVCRVGL